MWTEPSPEIVVPKLDPQPIELQETNAIVASVEPESIGEVLGFEPGDQLISVNGVKPRDLIDYRFLIAEEELNLEILDSKGNRHQVSLEKDADDGLGLAFTEALFDGIKQCNNKCPFCFIDQQPKGKRKTLYIKDDDFRLSFLYGSYLTLTNLTKTDWARIEEQRLSPLFVSVHATDPEIRSKLLKNPNAGKFLEQLNWFSKRHLQIHTQVVVCPGINDGATLEKTILDLAQFRQGEWPTVLSTAVVPVGLTRFRPNDDGLQPVDSDCAMRVIQQIENLQKQFIKNLGSRFAWLSDEWYLIAKKPLPPRNNYEDLPQQENGVGSIRAFLESMDIATSQLPKKIRVQKKCSWVVGQVVEKALTPTCERLNRIEGLTVFLYGLPSAYWGQEQVVTGLLTGQDLLEGLQGKNLGEELLLPAVMLREDQSVFLDDMTLADLEKALKVPIRVVNGAKEIVNTALGIEL